MPDVSPTRWHLAHTTWFFETFLLKSTPGYQVFHEDFEYLFNSYYNTVGEQFPRHRRGQISRPGLPETLDYRRHVDQHMMELFSAGEFDGRGHVIELGLHHEQQHQELILTDIKHVLSRNPLLPAYQTPTPMASGEGGRLEWTSVDEQLVQAGHADATFCFDNERPRHKTYLQAHELAHRCVTNGEYLQFVNDGGYRRPELWLSLGWAQVQQERWTSPLYWLRRDDQWHEFSLAGLHALEPNLPVCHLSYFEADAYARWAGCRLPTEFEWETHAAALSMEGNFADRLTARRLPIHPRGAGGEIPSKPAAMFGDVWEWTSSPYTAYPGYQPASGALGEYNGKFMCNQFVLRGGSCATSSDHIRPTYRNFFPPEARWQFTGFRLAR